MKEERLILEDRRACEINIETGQELLTGTNKAFLDALSQSGMDFSGPIDKSRAGQEDEAYVVNHPIVTRQRGLQFRIVREKREERYRMEWCLLLLGQ